MNDEFSKYRAVFEQQLKDGRKPKAATDAQVAEALRADPELDGLINTESLARVAFAAYRLGLAAHPAPSQAVGAVDGMNAEDAHNLNYLCRSLENLSLKRAPDPKDLDAEFFVTANIGHAVKIAKYWAPIVRDIQRRMWEALCRRADEESSTADQPVATAGDGVTEDVVRGAHDRYLDVVREGIAMGTSSVDDDNQHKAMRAALLFARAALTSPSAPRVGVPEAKVSEPDDHPDAGLYIKGWNDCREAMLAAAPEVPRG